ncbi:recombinase XerD [Agromyces sp. ISL-38]|uniref:recombinase XerD n=1 Tax=Agromyces sp. ISL-38 TaxID=2819107 RepID=UPI001BE84C81|nr:recombinase XerD [Agromyces sp. ISL-38]MBT2500039.1 recombinase XerD [Agromyces sp. ISL-38]
MHWPDGAICGICHYDATHTRGQCPECRSDRMLPGRNGAGQPVCVECAGITQRYECSTCGNERPPFRTRQCIQCSLESDLNDLLRPNASTKTRELTTLRDRLVSVSRPESIHTWMRNPQVQGLLTHLGDDATALSHEALDALPRNNAVQHFRAILVDLTLLPPRDEAISRFEHWLEQKFTPLEPSIKKPVERFATWHHLRRIRNASSDHSNSHAAVHNAKQEVTVAINFLTWLANNRGRGIAACTQTDVDRWLADGPTTHFTVRSFLVFAVDKRLCPQVDVPKRAARSTRRLTAEERLDWIRTCLVDDVDTVAGRCAAMLVLLFAQPVVRVVGLRADALSTINGRLHIRFADEPFEVPELFARLLRTHVAKRARTRTQTSASNPYLFPGGRAGTHLTQGHLRNRMTDLGINVLAARNGALDQLVKEMPAPLVADALGYSYAATTLHEQHVGKGFERYAALNSAHGTRADLLER